ncbi:hypothetical protein [Archangium violaceum]|uniref:Lipoprotein n=1 Tax=Archangium violaceum Cb vi76 TaxID=1406225 RepID=A0A084SR07_9BACT|nr:hypothetical protein [Archangium violaceum]KFA90892.1 hypothetical protein Q664_25340 [Archangium violaceum Cb vi76]
MNLRSTLYTVAAVMTVGVMGCGEQPRYYRVSIDRTALGSMPGSCYGSGTAPTPNDRTSNTVEVEQWVLWDGVEGGQYLEVSDINYPLGDARVDIDVSGAIVSTEADKPTFTTERLQTGPNRSSRATYTLDKAGETLEGTIALSYECTGATGCPVANCSASLPFVGRRVSAESMIVVNNGAN